MDATTEKGLKIINKYRKPTKEASALKDALEKQGVRVLVELHDGYKHIDLAIPQAKINVEVDGIQHHMWKFLLAQAFLALLTSLFIAFIMIEQSGLGSGVIYGEVGMIWLCFTVPIVGQSALWGNCDKKLRWKKFFSDIFSNLVTYLIIVLVFSFIV